MELQCGGIGCGRDGHNRALGIFLVGGVHSGRKDSKQQRAWLSLWSLRALLFFPSLSCFPSLYGGDVQVLTIQPHLDLWGGFGSQFGPYGAEDGAWASFIEPCQGQV